MAASSDHVDGVAAAARAPSRRRGDGARVRARSLARHRCGESARATAHDTHVTQVAVMGRVFSKEETDRFFDEALAFSEDRSALGVSSERDERGLLKRNVVEANPRRHALCLPKDDFVSYFSKFVTRTVDPREAAEHFRALVEGAAEQALRDPDTEASDELRSMADTKHRRVDELFIYARDLRKVVASMSERLTDEEADAFIRECKPEPLVGASDGGLERVYFHQYLNMLKDDS